MDGGHVSPVRHPTAPNPPWGEEVLVIHVEAGGPHSLPQRSHPEITNVTASPSWDSDQVPASNQVLLASQRFLDPSLIFCPVSPSPHPFSLHSMGLRQPLRTDIFLGQVTRVGGRVASTKSLRVTLVQHLFLSPRGLTMDLSMRGCLSQLPIYPELPLGRNHAFLCPLVSTNPTHLQILVSLQSGNTIKL